MSIRKKIAELCRIMREEGKIVRFTPESDVDELLTLLKAEIEKMENPYRDPVKYLIDHRQDGDVNRARREMAYARAIQDILKLL